MKSNSKSISKQTSQSQVKFKIENKQQQSYIPKQLIRKSSPSLKLNIKHLDGSSSKLASSVEKGNDSVGKGKRNIKTEVETGGGNAEGGVRRIVGWTELDKINYELAIQRRLRESLERENEMLKKEIAFLNNFGTSMRTSINSKKSMNEEQYSSNKEKILNRLNKKRQGVTALQKDNDSTGLYSAKNKTYMDKINQMYEEATKKKVTPILEGLYELAQEYFNQFQENYSKLFLLFNQTKGMQKTDLHAKMENLLFLYQAPISYKEKPKDLIREISKQRLNSQKSSLNSSFSKIRTNSQIKNQSPNQEKLLEYKSPSEIIQQLECLFGILLKNSKLLGKFLKTETFQKFLKKIKDKKL